MNRWEARDEIGRVLGLGRVCLERALNVENGVGNGGMIRILTVIEEDTFIVVYLIRSKAAKDSNLKTLAAASAILCFGME